MDKTKLEQRIERGDAAERRFKKLRKATMTGSELDEIFADLVDGTKALNESTSRWLPDPEIGIAKLRELERQAETASGTKRPALEVLALVQDFNNKALQPFRDHEIDGVKVPGLASIAAQFIEDICRNLASEQLTRDEKYAWAGKLIKSRKVIRSRQAPTIKGQGAAAGQ